METVSNSAALPREPGSSKAHRTTSGPHTGRSTTNPSHDCFASGCAEAASGYEARPGPDAAQHTHRQPRDQVDPSIWARADMRKALGRRDVASVFRILQRYGLSQRAISARVGMAQSEVCDIIKGRRRVMAYEVFVRIADGYGLPRGWLGVAYDQATAEFIRLSQLTE